MKKLLWVSIIALTLLTGCNGYIAENNNINSPATYKNGTSEDTTGQTDEKEYTSPKMEGEISISAMSEQEFITAAANQFMTKYPKVKVIINTYRGISRDSGANPPDEYSTENYRNVLNTKIMTGKAEDVIFTSNLPVKKYTDMGVFEDLSHFLSYSKEINAENYFMNVLEAPRDSKGKIYVLPYMASFQVIGFNRTLVSETKSELDSSMKTISFEKAAAFAQQLVNGTSKKNVYISQGDGAYYFSYLLKENLNKFVDMERKEARINTEQFINLLRQTKDLMDKGYFAAKNSIDLYNMEYYFAFSLQPDLQGAFNSLDSGSADCYVLPLSDTNGKVYTNPNYTLGINSASKNKALAWEFVKFLLSDEMQSAPCFYGLCVNKKGFEASIERNFKLYNNTKKNMSEAAYKKLLEGWVMQINSYSTLDPVIEDFFAEESGKFFEKKQSAEETARVLQAKINKYFNE